MEHLFGLLCGLKSPITGGHIRRAANLTRVMAEELHKNNKPPFQNVHFTPEKFHELRVASWLHDIGKVTTPVEIIEKSKKLEASTAKTIRELKEIREFIIKCNEPSEFLEDECIERLQAISKKTYQDEHGNEQPFLTPDELKNLSIRKGSINEQERQIMRNHAQITLDMLDKIPFTKKLKNIPNFSGAHHECINGLGYPLGLKGEEIPFEGKLMAVTNIAEALTAKDRPYKKVMPLEQVYKILRTMADKNELDRDLVEFFINEKIYEMYQAKHETPDSAQSSGASPKNKKDP